MQPEFSWFSATNEEFISAIDDQRSNFLSILILQDSFRSCQVGGIFGDQSSIIQSKIQGLCILVDEQVDDFAMGMTKNPVVFNHF